MVAVMVVGLGGLSVAAYVVMALLVIIWTLFAAPVWCGAINRERGRGVEYCRNNSSGLLLGCWIREHKFHVLKRTWWTASWRDRLRGTWAGAPAKIATLSAIVGLVALAFEIFAYSTTL